MTLNPPCPKCRKPVGYLETADLGRNGPRECPYCKAALVWSVTLGTLNRTGFHKAKPNASWVFAR